MVEYGMFIELMFKIWLCLWLCLLKVIFGIEVEICWCLWEDCDMILLCFDVLFVLVCYLDGLKMSEIFDFLKVFNGNVIGIVECLVDDGYVVCMVVLGDKWVNWVKLMGDGYLVFVDLVVKYESWIDELMSGFDGVVIEDCNCIFE